MDEIQNVQEWHHVHWLHSQEQMLGFFVKIRTKFCKTPWIPIQFSRPFSDHIALTPKLLSQHFNILIRSIPF